MLDTVEDLDDAILLCDSFADFVAATEEHPAALDGVDPRVFVLNRCESRPEMQPGPVCQQAAAE